MIYIFFEDRTSAVDIICRYIDTLKISQGIVALYPLGTHHTANDIAEDLTTTGESTFSYFGGDSKVRTTVQFRPSDLVLFLVDRTTHLSGLYNPLPSELTGIKIYRTTYYCFESCLFSYSLLFNELCGNPKLKNKAVEIKQLITDEISPTQTTYNQFREKWQVSPKTTLEQLANSVFSEYTSVLKCFSISKHGYTFFADSEPPLHSFWKDECFCEPLQKTCDFLHTKGYCSLQEPLGVPAVMHFFNNSLLKMPLRCIVGRGEPKTLHSLLI